MIARMQAKSAIFIVILVLGFAVSMTAAGAEETYTFNGRGTAHGVGLDMAGVQALAGSKGYEDILKTYYTGIAFAAGYNGEELRVGILNGGELQFTADSGYTVYANNAGSGTHVGRDVITHVTYEGGQYVTRIDGIGSWTLPGFTRLVPDGGGRIKILNNARRYRGHVEARRSSTSGLLWAIEVVNIEDYIKGIAEEPNTWPTEGQRTLAVAARTYALNKKFYSTRWDSENFDIDATLGSQYYLGYDAERPNLVQAAADTVGKVMVYGGRIIVAAYHGNSGGYTESIENVWGGSPSDYPYLRAVPSPWTPIYYWGPKTFTKSQLQAIFNSHSESSVGTLISMDLSDRGPSGRIRKVRLTGSAGAKEIWGYSQFAAWLGLPSALLDNGRPDDNWDESILLINPNSRSVDTTLTFMFPDNHFQRVRRRVAAVGRLTVAIDGLAQKGPVAVEVKGELPVVAERSVYFAHDGDGGGTNSIGARSPSRRWYFAEGRTGRGLDTYLLIQNPRRAPTRVTATFMPGDGRRIRKTVRVNGYSRTQLRVGSVPGLASASTPAVVTSRAPVVVERAVYFNRKGCIGGDASIGSKILSSTWYFAEGYTGAGFEDRLSLFNPSNAATTATVVLSRANGAQVSRAFPLSAKARRAVLLNNMISNGEFGITVNAASGIVAERTVYFNSGGKSGGHNTVGSTKTSKKWYFAEGYTGTGFDMFLTLLNPGAVPASVNVRYIAEGGGVTAERVHVVGAHRRKTITVGDIAELGPGRAVGMEISSDEPIVAERVMYFSYSGNNGQSTWTGGHATIGATAPSTRWFFAEGNTD